MPFVPLAPIAGAPRTNGARVLPTAELQAGNARQGMQMAQALGQAGEVLQKFQVQMAQASDAENLINAEGVMRKQAQEFDAWRNTAEGRDQEKWIPEWQRRQQATQEFIDGLKLTPDARLRLTQSFGRWSDGHAIAIQGEAVKTAVGRAKQAVMNRAEEAALAGDYAGIENSFRVLTPEQQGQYFYPEELDALKLDLRGKAQAAQRQQIDMQAETLLKNEGNAAVPKVRQLYQENKDLFTKDELANKTAGMERAGEFESLLVLTKDNPKMARELAMEKEKTGNISPMQRVKIVDEADSRISSYRAQEISGFTSRIKVGDLPSPDELKGAQYIDDVDRKAILTLATGTPSNDPEIFERASTEIDRWKPAVGDELAKARFEVWLESNFSGPYLDNLRAKWEAKTQEPASIVDTGEAFSALDKWAFDDQRLGQFKKPKTDAEGKPVFKKKEGGYFWDKDKGFDFFGLFDAGDYVKADDTYEQEFEPDPAARDKVMKSVGSIKETIRREVKEGKLLDSRAVFNRMAELAKMPLTTNAASEVNPPGLLLLPENKDAAPNLDDILKRYAPNPRK